MKGQTGIGVWVAAVLVLLVVAIYLGYFIPKQSEITNQEFLPGCPKNVKLRYDCPCNNIPVTTGYCCETGPSDVPCWCSDEKVNICTDYKTAERCKENPCTASPRPPFVGCNWFDGACS